MATIANWNNCADQWNSSAGPQDAENLEDKFWAAFNLSFDDIKLDCVQLEPPGSAVDVPSPVARGAEALPCVRHRDPTYSIYQPRRNVEDAIERAEPYRQVQRPERKQSGSLRLQVPSSTSVASVTLSPSTAIPRSPFSPSAKRNQWHLPTPGGFKPSTPTLQLVSNFLDSIVRLSDSRSSTPAASVTISDDGDELIVESDVLIQVVEDTNRSTLNTPVERRKEDRFSRLQIPAPLLAISGTSGGPGYDVSTGFVVNGPAGCAQELDALSWMNWDRQLSNVQHLLWH